MKIRYIKTKTFASLIAVAIVATLPLMAPAKDSITNSGSTSNTAVSRKTGDSMEISRLKAEIYDCHHPKRFRRVATQTKRYHRVAALPVIRVIEKRTIVERPVIVEKVVEKLVYVDRPVEKIVEKQVVVERPMEMERRVVVEHSAHRKHLLHFGIPFIGVTLF